MGSITAKGRYLSAQTYRPFGCMGLFCEFVDRGVAG